MTSKRRVDFFIKKLKWLDDVGMALGKDHLTAHVATIIAKHMNSNTGETFVGRRTIADLVDAHVRSVELSIKKLEELGYLHVQRARGRGHVNIYTLAFPEKAISAPPFDEEKAVATPPFCAEENAVADDKKGGEKSSKRRPHDRPNLKEYNLKDLTLGYSEKIGDAVAAPPSPPRPLPAALMGPQKLTGADQSRTFSNRGLYEQHLAELIDKSGGRGWDVVMGLDEVRVAALCRRLKNGTLTQIEVNELCAPLRRAGGASG